MTHKKKEAYLKILLINKFLYPKGGDAISTLMTGRLLQKHGHQVAFWGMSHPDNPAFLHDDTFVPQTEYNEQRRFSEKARAAVNILYSINAQKKIAEFLSRFKPDLVHLNNFAHQISPSILDVIRKYHIPAVMTMHDYKMVCPSYSMLSNGSPCERCAGQKYHQCAIRRCTKGSLFKSMINVAEMTLHHRVLHIYDAIDQFIAPSRFMMNKVKSMGFNGNVVWLPNAVDISTFTPVFGHEEKSAVYVGRLSPEKGIETMIDGFKGTGLRLKIIGDGPLKASLEHKCQKEHLSYVKFFGYLNGHDLFEEIKKSMFLVIPSEWYENNPRAVIEAFSLGKPVLGARIGGIPELVRDGITGLTFTPGDTTDLNAGIKRLISDTDTLAAMGKNARAFVENELNWEKHYNNLMLIYDRAIDTADQKKQSNIKKTRTDR